METTNVTIIYDEECPFCSDFVALNNLRESGYLVKLVNARESDDEVVSDLKTKYNLDDGMIVIVEEAVLYGAAAAMFIAASYSRRGVRSAMYAFLLSNEHIAAIVYPVLVTLRKFFFRIIGKKLINEQK